MSIKISLVLLIIGILLLVFYIAPLPGLQESGDSKIEYQIRTVTDIVSAAYKVYGKLDLGLWVAKVILTNNGTAPAYNVQFSYGIDTYSSWSEGGTYPIILPGSTVVDLYYPIISPDVAKLTTSTPSRINIKITYADAKGVPHEISEKRQVNILGIHDFLFSSLPPEENLGTFYDIFNNYPLIAAWVTPTDPVVIQFADLGNKLAGGAGATLSDQDALKSLEGMWVLSVYNGIQYKTEPSAFWTGKISQYVKYPRDVIRTRAATCLDSAIFFASLAMAQGLKAYVVLMPGHAFTIVKLPESGSIIPIETTTLNQQVSFSEAVQTGVKVFQEAMNDPHYIIDVQQLQAAGITPPELEQLPSDILQSWGITTPQAGGGEGGTGGGGGGTGMQTYTNHLPKWSITYPNDWSIDTSNVDQAHGYVEIDFQPYGALLISWDQGYTMAQVRSDFEETLNSYGTLQVLNEKQISVSGGVSAILVVYSWNTDSQVYGVMARYFNHGGYGFVMFYYHVYTGNDDNVISALESVVSTFKLG